MLREDLRPYPGAIKRGHQGEVGARAAGSPRGHRGATNGEGTQGATKGLPRGTRRGNQGNQEGTCEPAIRPARGQRRAARPRARRFERRPARPWPRWPCLPSASAAACDGAISPAARRRPFPSTRRGTCAWPAWRWPPMRRHARRRRLLRRSSKTFWVSRRAVHKAKGRGAREGEAPAREVQVRGPATHGSRALRGRRAACTRAAARGACPSTRATPPRPRVRAASATSCRAMRRHRAVIEGQSSGKRGGAAKGQARDRRGASEAPSRGSRCAIKEAPRHLNWRKLGSLPANREAGEKAASRGAA